MTQRKRSQSRLLAVQALCLFESLGDAFSERLPEFLRDPENCAELEMECPPAPEIIAFATELARSAWRQRKTLDERIQKVAVHWALGRMPPVDRNILRLGLHELLEHRDTPAQVVINEAIELARALGDADSPAFVNGLLDALKREDAATVAPGAGGAEAAAAGLASAAPASDSGEGRDGTV